MDIIIAMHELHNGAKITRDNWTAGAYIQINSEGWIVGEDGSICHSLSLLYEDGWKLYKEPKPMKKITLYRPKWMYAENGLYDQLVYRTKQQWNHNIQSSIGTAYSDEWDEITIEIPGD